MNARSWFLVGAKVFGVYLLLRAFGALLPIVLYFDAPHQQAAQNPQALLLELFRSSILPLLALLVVDLVLGLILIYKTSRLADYLRFHDDNPGYGTTEQVYLRSGLTLLGLVWFADGLVQGLARLSLPADALALARQIQPWIETGFGLTLIIWSREIAHWAQHDRRF